MQLLRRISQKLYRWHCARVLNTSAINLLKSPDEAIFHIFSHGEHLILQVGANDGVSSDPVRKLFDFNPNIRAVLIEPLPYYFKLLKQNYAKDSGRVLFLNIAVSNNEESRPFYYIEEDVADEMDGEGPKNRWAHGQGSFHKDSIIYWIKQNQFRGSKYRKDLHRYISSIRSVDISCLTIRSVIAKNAIRRIDLLVVDTQGHEMSVIKSCDFSIIRPHFIYYEDDCIRKNLTLARFLLKSDYEFVCGDDTNKLWRDSRRKTVNQS